MLAHQLIPPGGIDLHAALVAASPAAGALAAGMAGALAGGSKPARALAWMGMLAALVLAACFLLPHGLAAASDYPLGRMWVRLGPAQAGSMLLCGIWAVGAWRHGSAQDISLAGWGLRVCVAMLMPIVLVPALGLLALRDRDAGSSHLGVRWRSGSALALIAATILVWWTRDADAGDVLAPRMWDAAALLLAAWPAAARWRPVLVLGALGALVPLPA